MQALHLKKVIFFFVFLFCLPQLSKCLSDTYSLKKADSLYKIQNFSASEAIFERELPKIEKPSHIIFLKLANINEKKGDYLRSLYYLNKAYEIKPNEKILAKLSDIAQKYDLKGYEMNDFNFLILLYKQYSGFLIGLMLVIAIYIFVVLFIKKYKNQYTPFSQKVILAIYLIGIATLLNLPDKYHQGIINSDGVLLRTEPSAASGVEVSINKGHRLNIIGGEDIWRRVFWNDKLLYVKQSDIWMVE
jgi:tetratricopeptide (TPR) repeat protein